MTAGTAHALSLNDIRDLLIGVGLDRSQGPEAFSRTFADLDLDSLARVELASRLKTRVGLDLEDVIRADSTPAQVLQLVNKLAAAGTGAR